MKTITATANATHAFEVQIGANWRTDFVRVEANTRSQAVKAAKAAGFDVWSVNMVA